MNVTCFRCERCFRVFGVFLAGPSISATMLWVRRGCEPAQQPSQARHAQIPEFCFLLIRLTFTCSSVSYRIGGRALQHVHEGQLLAECNRGTFTWVDGRDCREEAETKECLADRRLTGLLVTGPGVAAAAGVPECGLLHSRLPGRRRAGAAQRGAAQPAPLQQHVRR